MTPTTTNSSEILRHIAIKATALATPGVTAAGTINTPPLSGSGSTTSIYRDGTAQFGVSQAALGAKFFDISPGYLKAAATRLMAGRDFTWQDDANSPKVAVINQTFARKLFGNASAIGQHFMTGKEDRYEIVGIVEDGKYDSLTEDPSAAVFYPLAQGTNSRTILVLRSQLPPADAAKALNHILSGIDPALPISIESWPASLGLVLFPARVAAASLGIMGLLAAMLAITGTFGVAAYSVSKRMRELGIRVALGARRTQLMRSALGRPLVLLTSGSLVGLALGMLVSRFLAQIVYHATSRDPLVMGGVVATMALIGLVATWIPARHASLSWKPMHGYALALRLKDISEDYLQIEEGSLYPALQRMLKTGWLETEMGLSARNRPVRMFKVTEAGKKHLEQEIASVEKMFAGITRVLALAEQ